MHQEKRKIALLVDNCTAHNHLVPILKNIEVIYFPANCTSILQPLDMGIIKCTKSYYRTRLVERIIINIERKLPDPQSVNVKQACEMIAGSWSKLNSEIIANCWRKAGFKLSVEGCNDVLEENDSFQALESTLSIYQDHYGQKLPSAEDYLAVDDDILVFPESTEEDILAEIQEARNDCDEEEGDGESDQRSISTLTPTEAVSAIEGIQDFLSSVAEVPDSHLVCLDAIRSLCVKLSVKKTTKQSVISDFFSKSAE